MTAGGAYELQNRAVSTVTSVNKAAALLNTALLRITQREDEKQMSSKLFWRQSVSYYAFMQIIESYILSYNLPQQSGFSHVFTQNDSTCCVCVRLLINLIEAEQYLLWVFQIAISNTCLMIIKIQNGIIKVTSQPICQVAYVLASYLQSGHELLVAC